MIEQAFKNFARHFMVWGVVFIIVMLFGMQNEKVSVERPYVEGSPYSMVKDCESVVTGDFAGKVLIQRPSNGAEWAYSDKAVGKAIDDVLNVKDWKNVRVIAFCK